LPGVRGTQSGQALVAALVIMLILFALAGGVAVAASGLLQQGRMRAGSVHDLEAQSAVADAVAQVAGTTSFCTVPARSGTFPEVGASDSTTLPDSYPAPVSPATTFVSCVRVDHVTPALSMGLSNAMPWPTAHCGVSQALDRAKLEVLFDMRGPAAGAPDATVYVDDQAQASGCRQTLPGSAACSAQGPLPHCIVCGRVVDPGIPLAQVTFDCDLSGVTSPAYLHVYNPSFQSPSRAFTAARDDNGGSMYLLATQLPAALRAGTDYEETVLLVPPQGAADELLYKGPMP
jgi:hypothetical protein